jgi:hypothetical protein
LPRGQSQERFLQQPMSILCNQMIPGSIKHNNSSLRHVLFQSILLAMILWGGLFRCGLVDRVRNATFGKCVSERLPAAANYRA